jgi:hypothetical protein
MGKAADKFSRGHRVSRRRHWSVSGSSRAWGGMVGLLLLVFLFPPGGDETAAQLSGCTPLQELQGAYSRCERLGVRRPAELETIPGLSSQEPRPELPGERRFQPKRNLFGEPLDTTVVPRIPPIRGARDMLNRLEPDRAIHPLPLDGGPNP